MKYLVHTSDIFSYSVFIFVSLGAARRHAGSNRRRKYRTLSYLCRVLNYMNPLRIMLKVEEEEEEEEEEACSSRDDAIQFNKKQISEVPSVTLA